MVIVTKRRLSNAFLFYCRVSEKPQRMSLPSEWPHRWLEKLAACHHGKLPCYHGE